MKKIMKKCAALFLAAGLAVSSLSGTNTTTSSAKTNVSAEKKVVSQEAGSLSSFLSAEASEAAQENSSYYISDVQVTDNEVAVVYQTLENANLTVAFYDEESMVLKASATTEVSAEANCVNLKIEGDLPEYYIVSAYLTDLESNAPLSEAYTSQMYTKEIQKIIGSEISDYDSSKTVNFDNNAKTNFAVYADDTVVAKESDSENLLTENSNGSYTIKEASEAVKSLDKGDVLAVETEKGDVVVISVSSVSVLGSTVTLTNDNNITIDDVFDVVKFDSECDTSEMTADTSDLDEYLEFEGITKNKASSQTETKAINEEASVSYSAKYKITKDGLKKDEPEENTAAITGSVTGTLELKVEGKVSVYLSKRYKYVSAIVSGNADFAITATGKFSHDFKLGILSIPTEVPGVYVEISPVIPFSITGAVSAKFSLYTTLGGAYDSDTGFVNKSTNPGIQLKRELKAEVTISIGLQGKISIAIIKDELISVSITPTISAEAVASMSKNTLDIMKHDCEKCIDGDVYAKFELGLTAKIGTLQKSKNFPVLANKIKLADFYCSIDKGEFDWGECPYISYKVTVKTVDSDNNPVADVEIQETGLATAPKTNEKGIATFYLRSGTYGITATNGTVSGRADFNVVNLTKTLKIVLTDGYNITKKMKLYGDAQEIDGKGICLTPCETWKSGGVWYKEGIDTTKGFTVNFKYKAGGGRGDDYGGADGISVDFASKIGLGDQGEYLGFVDGYGVELDSYPKNPNDPDGKHIAIIKDSVKNHVKYKLDDRVDDGSWHSISVSFNKNEKTLNVSLDGSQVLSASDVVMADTVYMGLTAATGSGKNYHFVDDFYISIGNRNISVLNKKNAAYVPVVAGEKKKYATGYVGEEEESGGKTTVSFDGLKSGEKYLLVDVTDTGTEKLFEYSNLLYINQGTADADGKLKFTFTPRSSKYTSSIRLYGAAEYQEDDSDLIKELESNAGTGSGTATTTGHSHCWQSWKTIKAATVLKKGTQKRQCSSCDNTQTRTIAKLKPTITLSKKKVVIKRKKSLKIRVSGLAKGDSVKSWKSNRKKIATVKNGKIQAKKKGKAIITVSLRSGKKARIQVKVK